MGSCKSTGYGRPPYQLCATVQGCASKSRAKVAQPKSGFDLRRGTRPAHVADPVLQPGHLVAELLSARCHCSISVCARSKKLSGGTGFASAVGSAGSLGQVSGVEGGDFVTQALHSTLSVQSAIQSSQAALFSLICDPFSILSAGALFITGRLDGLGQRFSSRAICSRLARVAQLPAGEAGCHRNSQQYGGSSRDAAGKHPGDDSHTDAGHHDPARQPRQNRGHGFEQPGHHQPAATATTTRKQPMASRQHPPTMVDAPRITSSSGRL